MPDLKAAVRRRHFRAYSARLAIAGVVAFVLGFFVFLWLLPAEEVELDRNADGIVVLTGGTSRITDALELLAARRGKRLLITGVNPGTTTADIAHQFADSERPRWTIAARAHAIDEASEFGRADGDDVAGLVRKSAARNVAVLDRGVHRAEKQHRAVRILMVLVDHLRDEIGGRAADLRQG